MFNHITEEQMNRDNRRKTEELEGRLRAALNENEELMDAILELAAIIGGENDG